MRKKTEKNAKAYKSVCRSVEGAMRRDKILNYGKVSSLLMRVFTTDNKLTAAQYAKLKIVGFKNFTEWRDYLATKEWIKFELRGDGEIKYSYYSPGARLVEYVNQVKSLSTAATLDELQAVDAKAEATREEVRLLRLVVESFIEKYDPPVTKSKVDKHLSLVKGSK